MCTIFCATANPVQILVAVTGLGRGVIGVIDGRRALLRAMGYKF